MLVHLLTPEKRLYSGEAVMVLLRSGDGDIAFLANHSPFIGTLEIGVVKIERAEESTILASVHGGFVKVAKNEVYVLASVAELAGDIDVERAKIALAAATQAFDSSGDPNQELAMSRAKVRIEVASVSSSVA